LSRSCQCERPLDGSERGHPWYNRITDSAFDPPEHRALREVYRDGAVVVTPNPHNHALLAGKRKLSLPSDPAMLKDWGLESKTYSPA